MARLLAEATSDLSTTPITSYDKTKWNLSSLMQKRTDVGSTSIIGPCLPVVFRPVEQSAAIPGFYPHVIRWSSSLDWIFLADQASAAATRRVQLYTYNRVTGAVDWRGFVTLTYPAATNHTIRAMRMTLDRYTTGTASVSGTAVTGSGTAWSTDRMCVGSRIGFGSSDPTQISTWYEISAVGSDTSITLTTSAGTIGSGAYVIEDLRCITVTTNATTTNGGVFVAKGLRYEIFQSAGVTIPAATTIDSIRAVYWLADASTVTNITAAGAGIDAKTDWVNQDLYVLDLVSAGNYKVYKYNCRKALTLTSGKDTTCLLLATGNNAFTGTGSQTNNSRLGVLNHGPHSGVKCLYFVSTTRIMAAPVSGITSGSTTWIASTMTEVPPGGVATYAATNALAACEIIDTLDRLFVQTTNATGFLNYITRFRTDGGQIDHVLGVDDKQIDQAGSDATTAPHGTTLSVAQTTWVESGLMYCFGVGTTAATNIGHMFPVGADWQYSASTGEMLVSPAISTPNCRKFWRAYCVRDTMLGGDNLGMGTQPLRMFYRTTGIDDNSGTWIQIPDGNDLSGVDGAEQIQFMVRFRVISSTLVPGRIVAVAVAYEDNTTASQYQLSVGLSNLTTKAFAFRHAVAFGSTVPRLRITLYDAVTGSTLNTDDSVTQSGTWAKSTDGGSSWGSYNTTDKTNETTYIRYIPSSLSDGVNVVPILSVY